MISVQPAVNMYMPPAGEVKVPAAGCHVEAWKSEAEIEVVWVSEVSGSVRVT